MSKVKSGGPVQGAGNLDAGAPITDGGLPAGGVPEEVETPMAPPVPQTTAPDARWAVPPAPGASRAAEVVIPPVAPLNDAELQQVAWHKGTCPFIGTGIATRDLKVRGSADNPLIALEDIVKAGNSGGGDLGTFVARVFGAGNHAFMFDANHELKAPVPPGTMSAQLVGSQGAHSEKADSQTLIKPGSGFDSGRLGPNDPEVIAHFNDMANLGAASGHPGWVTTSDIGKFIAANAKRDKDNVVLLGQNDLLAKLGMDLVGVGESVVPSLLAKIEGNDPATEREFIERVTKVLGQDNIIGSAGEFALFFAFVAHQPNAKKINGELAISVEDLRSMFFHTGFPAGWKESKKTTHDWVVATSHMVIAAEKEYRRLNPPPAPASLFQRATSLVQRALNWIGP